MKANHSSLSELSQLLITFSKENKNLVNLLKEGEDHNPQERELTRELLKINIQLALQLKEEFNNLNNIKEQDKFTKMQYDFQIECATLENLAEQILRRERRYSKYNQCADQAPLLNDSENCREEEKDLKNVIEGKSLLLQEATESLGNANRKCNELEFIVANQSFDHQEDWRLEGIKNKQKRTRSEAKAK